MKKQTTQLNLERANALFEEGKQLLRANKYEAAIACLKQVGQFYEEQKKWKQYIKAKNITALAHIGLQEFEQAGLIYQNNLLLLSKNTKLPSLTKADTYKYFAYYTVVTDEYYQKSNFEKEAQTLCQKALKIYQQKADKCGIAEINLIVIHSSYIKSDNIKENILKFEQIASNLEDLVPSYFGLFTLLYKLLWSYIVIRDLTKAEQIYQKALDLKTFNLSTVANLYAAKGYIFLLKKDNKQALLYYYKALEIKLVESPHETMPISECYYTIGKCYQVKGNSKKALTYYTKALDLLKQILPEEHPYMATIYFETGTCYRQLNKLDKTLEMYHKCLAIRLKVFGDNHLHTAIIYNSIGFAYQHKKDNKQALFYYFKALNIYKQVDSISERIVRNHINIAQLYCEQKDYEQALVFCQKSIALLINYDNSDKYSNPPLKKCLEAYTQNWLIVSILTQKASIFKYLSEQQNEQKVYYLELAFQTFQLLFKLLIQIKYSHKSDEAKLYANTHTKDFAYIYAINVALNLDKQAAAFQFSEQSKAILLLSNLQENDAKIAANIPSKLLEKEKQLKIELNYLDKNIAKTEAKKEQKDEKLLLKFKSQYFDFKQEYDQLIEQFEISYPDYFQLKHNTKTADIQDIQQLMPKDGVMISYFIGEENYYIFAISEHDYEVIELPKPADFEEKITLFTQAIDRHNKKEFTELSHEIYQLLIAPIDYLILDAFEEIAHKPLIIIPHDILNYLPFEALIYEKANENTAYDELSFLLKQCVISYHYSATLWLNGVKKAAIKRQLPNNFVGFAPIYENETKDTQIEKTLNLSAKNMRSWAIRSAAFEGESWKALPYSKTEVKNVQQLFEEKGHKANTFLYETANKNNFIAEAKKAKFLLIAAHGLVNDEQPDLGGLVFFPSKNISQNFEAKGESNKENESRSIDTETAKQATNDDSILSMKEAYLLNLQADLVVLSACESGIGKLTKGEGMMAINRGFLHSGASNVIFTLFKVYDKPSSELILLLFTEILGGKPYAEALQAAKLAFLKQKMADPKLWTSYILIGS